MNTLEKLAIEHGATTWNNNEVKFRGKHISFTPKQLEAFAKALQSSEPVAKVIHTKGTGLLEGKTITKVMLDINHVDLPAGTELFTHPPASVPLEKYNKLLDALRHYEPVISATDNSKGFVARQAIAEAEGKEG